MTTTTHQFLELEHYNNSDKEVETMLRYTGADFLDDSQVNVWCYKYILNSSNFPKFLPTIIPEFIPHKIDNNTYSVNTNTEGYHYTDWVVSCKIINGTTDNSTTSTAPVRWIRDDMIKQEPLEPMINQKYFWLNNSDQLCRMVSDALTQVLGTPSFFVKSGDRWTILVDAEVFKDHNVIIYFNDKMRKYFNFDYQHEKNGIAIHKMQIQSLYSGDYFSITSNTTNNRLFPFNKIIFYSDNLSVPRMNFQQSNTGLINQSRNVIFTYHFEIDDISSLGTSMSYNSDNKDRSMSLLHSDIHNLNIQVAFVQHNGDIYTLKLEPGDSISLSFMFY